MSHIGLTTREESILHLVSQGKTNKEIGRQLEVSEGTVKATVRRLFDKLAARKRSQLVKVAFEQYGGKL